MGAECQKCYCCRANKETVPDHCDEIVFNLTDHNFNKQNIEREWRI